MENKVECWSCGEQIDYPEYISNKPLCSTCAERIRKGNEEVKNKMTKKDGCYDIDGKCVNCGKFHPCDCEIEDVEPTLEDCHELTAIPNIDGYDYDSQEED